MKNIKFLILLLFLLPLSIGSGQAHSDITLQSASDKTAEPPPEQPEDGPVIFTLDNGDILSWEESGEGKYIYFSISDEKNEELARITKDRLGQKMRINIGDSFILIPKITNTLHQKNGFVLLVEKGKRTEFMLSLLDWSKQSQAVTELEIETPSIDGAAQSVLQTDE